MKKNNTLINITGISIFTLISTLYSPLDIFAYFMFIILFLYLMLAGRFKSLSRIEIIFSGLLLTTLFSLLSSIDINTSLVPSIYFFFMILFSLSISKSITSLIDFEKILFFGLIGFLVFNIRNFFGDFTSIRFAGVAGQPNALGLISGTGMVISTAYLYLFSQSRFLSNPISYIVLITSFFLVLASGSRGAFISVFIPLLYLFIRNLKNNFKTILVLSTFLASLFVIFYDKISTTPLYTRLILLPNALGFKVKEQNIDSQLANAADDSRLDIVDTAFKAFLNKPLFGNGTSTFSYFSDYVYTHNTYLEILFSQGILGSVVYLMFLFMSLTTKSKLKDPLSIKINKSKNFVLFYFILAGLSLPNYQNKSQVIIYSFLLITTKIILSRKDSDISSLTQAYKG